ncbi:MAG: hypothetical protein NC313_09895 [Butyrivibrio sp.]|nr:hypothetical protein [Butyrivibrio sp.]
MKGTKKLRLQMLLLPVMLVVLLGCGAQSTTSLKDGETDLEEMQTEQTDNKGDSKIIDELWEKLDGVWREEGYTFQGITTYADLTLEFQYIDKNPCMVKNVNSNGQSYYIEDFVYGDSAVKDDEYHYKVYQYKKDSYNTANSSWDDDILLVGMNLI